MRKISVVLVVVVLAACGGKKEENGGAAKTAPPVPTVCPPGALIKDGACVAVVTPEKIAAVTQQQSRVDELAKLLEKVDAVAVPVELLGGFRQVEQWKAFAATNDRAKLVDESVAVLDAAVKKLRAFREGLGQASGRLANLRGELEKLLIDTSAAKRIEDVRQQISQQVTDAIAPLGAQVADTVQNALAPLIAQFEDVSNVVKLGCAAMALGRASDQAKELCTKAETAFADGKRFLADFSVKPAVLFAGVKTQLEAALVDLIDAQAKRAIDAAQTAVNQALKLPAGGSAAGSGSSAAAPAP